MGFALAAEAKRLGAVVELISGPVHLETPHGVRRTDVETADQMHQAVLERIVAADIFIGAAAVSDMRPAQPATHKLKKQSEHLNHLELVENPDIVQSVASHPHRPQLVVGFAAETDDVERHARSKLTHKALDCIIANDVSGGQVFGRDITAVSIIDTHTTQHLSTTTKEDAAKAILAHLSVLLSQGPSHGTAI
jgi:Phosphopantothenoylcysteine synthetase/decarboxylase